MAIRSRHAGISLIEVLVVIVILVIGIFSVIRLFPPGFLINRWTENTSLADRLAKGEMDRQGTLSANLPDAIVGLKPDPNNANNIIVAADIGPDDVTDVTTAPPGVDPYYLSNVNRIRHIIGETVRVPVASPTASGSGSVYMLANGPIYAPPDPNSGTFQNITITGAPLVLRVESMDDANSPYVYGPGQCAVDFDNSEVAFYRVPYTRTFAVRFSYNDSGNNNDVKTIPSPQLITLDGTYNGAWIPLNLPANSELVPDSVTVSRAFNQLPAATTGWSSDPYEFRVLSAPVAAGGFANVGVLAFNPAGRDYTEQSALGNVPLTAKVDYDVLDWRIIREDRPMPADVPYTIRLSLKNLKKYGDIQDDQTLYPGLFRIAGAPQDDLMVYDLSTGTRVDPANYAVDYGEGLVAFSSAFGAQNSSGSFRIFYKAHGDWALQIQKGVTQMTRTYSQPVPFGQYFVGTRNVLGDPDPHPVLYMTLSEAGKTVSVRELWYVQQGSNTPVRAANETYRVNDNPAAYVTLNGQVATFVDLRDRHGSGNDVAVGWGTAYGVPPVTGVQGVSFKVRVLWQNGSRISETAGGNVVRTRYRKVDLDTLMTRTRQ